MMFISIAQVIAQNPRGRVETGGGTSFVGMIMFFVIGFIAMFVIARIKNNEEANKKANDENQ